MREPDSILAGSRAALEGRQSLFNHRFDRAIISLDPSAQHCTLDIGNARVRQSVLVGGEIQPDARSAGNPHKSVSEQGNRKPGPRASQGCGSCPCVGTPFFHNHLCRRPYNEWQGMLESYRKLEVGQPIVRKRVYPALIEEGTGWRRFPTSSWRIKSS